MWRCRMHPRGPCFFSFGRGGDMSFFSFLFGLVCKVIVKLQK
jgi:hypothetical protein